MNEFDPNAAAGDGAGIFGLPHDAASADLVLVPVPYAATTSYGRGAERGPEAILRASVQVDLFDLQTGKPYERGIHMLTLDDDIVALDAKARASVEAGRHREADAAGAEVNDFVEKHTRAQHAAGKLVGVVGGDHAVPFGAMRAAGAKFGAFGVLHIDAHADLRRAYEGLKWSHASIFDNVLQHVPEVERLVQVGIRDFCEEEFDAIQASEGRIRTWFDLDWQRRRADGEALQALCDEVVEALPDRVWVSCDIDGLDPKLCPGTGTPVPGGLDFTELCVLLDTVARSGRRIIGFDLCEVAPAAGDGEWNANVGARVLYKLCGFALLTN